MYSLMANQGETSYYASVCRLHALSREESFHAFAYFEVSGLFSNCWALYSRTRERAQWIRPV